MSLPSNERPRTLHVHLSGADVTIEAGEALWAFDQQQKLVSQADDGERLEVHASADGRYRLKARQLRLVGDDLFREGSATVGGHGWTMAFRREADDEIRVRATRDGVVSSARLSESTLDALINACTVLADPTSDLPF